MVLPMAIAGASLLGLGTLGGIQASKQRESALRGVVGDRQDDLKGFNQRRAAALEGFGQGLLPIAADRQNTQLNAIRGLSGLGQIQQQGIQQGNADLDAASAQVFGQAPVSSAFGTATGSGARTLQGFNAQQQPGVDARRQLAALGLGQIAVGRERGNLGREQQLGLAANRASLQRLQGNNSLANSQIGLEDLINNQQFQQSLQSAGQKGGGLAAFSGLAQSVGGGMLGGAF